MGAFRDLQTLAEVQAARVGKPLWKGATRLETKTASDKDDATALEHWKRAVRTRDRHRCRVCGVKTKTTLELDPKRGEAHHIVSRTDRVVRHDVRNGLLVCAKHHQQLTRHKLFVVGTAAQMFVAANGRQYLDAKQPLTFTPEKPV